MSQSRTRAFVSQITENLDFGNPNQMSFDDVVKAALKIEADHAYGAEMDAGFDAGEWSGPAHGEMAEEEIRELCANHGFDYEEVMGAMINQRYADDDPTPMDEGLEELEGKADAVLIPAKLGRYKQGNAGKSLGRVVKVHDNGDVTVYINRTERTKRVPATQVHKITPAE